MALAFLVVDVDIPFIPLAQPVLQGFGAGTHASLVCRNPLPTVALGLEAELVAAVEMEE